MVKIVRRRGDTMEKIIILGCGDHALEAADAVIKSKCELVGFIDERETESGIADVPVLGGYETISKLSEQGCHFISGSREHTVREKQQIKFRDIPWTTVIHPSAECGIGVQIGEGSFIGAGVILGAGAIIGQQTVIESGTIVGTAAEIGDYCQILSRVNIGCRTEIGSHTFIGQSATLKDRVRIAEKTVIQTGEIVVKDMVMKMVYKRGAWIYKENG